MNSEGSEASGFLSTPLGYSRNQRESKPARLPGKPRLAYIRQMKTAADASAHGEGVYRAKAPADLSWYKVRPERSLELMRLAGAGARKVH